MMNLTHLTKGSSLVTAIIRLDTHRGSTHPHLEATLHRAAILQQDILHTKVIPRLDTPLNKATRQLDTPLKATRQRVILVNITQVLYLDFCIPMPVLC